MNANTTKNAVQFMHVFFSQNYSQFIFEMNVVATNVTNLNFEVETHGQTCLPTLLETKKMVSWGLLYEAWIALFTG